MRRMRAISPVIATVIIVAVTIAVAVAVALWLTGLVGGFTGTENLQIVNAYAVAGTNGWNVYLTVKNAGTTTASVTDIFVNGVPYGQITVSTATTSTIIVSYVTTTSGGATSPFSPPVSIKPGETYVFKLFIPKGSGTPFSFSSGQSVEIKLHTASGKDYPVQVILP
ncbi:MAG: archaellin/type IV pilin N-terminal domain-containing protein [Desulfurococcaceae archaeon]